MASRDTADHLFQAGRFGLSPWAQVLLTNVVLATATTVVFLGAPLVSASLGALGAGILIILAERRRRLATTSRSTAPDVEPRACVSRRLVRP